MPASKCDVIGAVLGLCILAGLSPAWAAVVNRDSARECYLATLKNASPENSQAGLQACSVALEAATDDDLRAGLLVNRAYIRLRMADYPGTVADADASLSLVPDLPAADLNRGAGLIGMGRYQDALPALEKAVALSSGDGLELAYYNRGIAREHLGGADGDIRALISTIRKRPNSIPNSRRPKSSSHGLLSSPSRNSRKISLFFLFTN